MSGPASLRVCLVTPYYFPVHAGAAERFRRYAPGLRKRGVDLSVITVNFRAAARQELIEGTNVYRVPTVPKSSPGVSGWLMKNAVRLIGSEVPRPDVVQVLGHSIRGVPYAFRLRSRRIPVVGAVTTMPYRNSEEYRRPRQMLHQWARNLPFNKVVVSSRVMAEQVSHWVPRRKLAVIPNGVDTGRFSPAGTSAEKRDIRERLGLPLSGEVVLFVGFLSMRKGVDRLFDAWTHVATRRRSASLVLVGPRSWGATPTDFDSAFDRRIATSVSQLAGLSNVVLRGEVRNVEDYYRAADVFVLPSRLEGMSNVTVEAMASGLPCVLTAHTGFPAEFGEPGQHYIVSGESPGELAEAILEPLEDQCRRKNVGHAGRQLMSRTMDVQRSLDLYAALYYSLARQSGLKRRERQPQELSPHQAEDQDGDNAVSVSGLQELAETTESDNGTVHSRPSCGRSAYEVGRHACSAPRHILKHVYAPAANALPSTPCAVF